MGFDSLLATARLYAKIVSSYMRKRVKLGHPPAVLWVEPTNKCNLKCAMCPNSVLDKSAGGYMDEGTLRKIVDEFGAMHPRGTGVIALFLGGEPLLHDRIFDMIAYARGRGLAVNLATNATLLSREKAELILEKSPSLLILSFDGYDKESYEKARLGARFERTVGNILHLLEEKRRLGRAEPRIRLYSLVLDTAASERERERFVRFYRETFGGRGIDEFLIEDARGWAGLFGSRGDERFTPRVERGRKYFPCTRLWDSMSILWDGRVVPCCADFAGEVVLGNVRNASIGEIWNGGPYVSLREKMLAKDLGGVTLCSRGCEMLTPAGTLWGVPAEWQVHRKIARDAGSRRFAARINRG